MSARVFWLKDAVFKALSIFVLKAAISLHPLAKAPDPKSEIINSDASNFFIIWSLKNCCTNEVAPFF